MKSSEKFRKILKRRCSLECNFNDSTKFTSFDTFYVNGKQVDLLQNMDDSVEVVFHLTFEDYAILQIEANDNKTTVDELFLHTMISCIEQEIIIRYKRWRKDVCGRSKMRKRLKIRRR